MKSKIKLIVIFLIILLSGLIMVISYANNQRPLEFTGCLNIELNDTNIYIECDNMLVYGGVAVCSNDSITLIEKCGVKWTAYIENCDTCYCQQFWKVKIDKTYDEWQNK